jgi:GNAT superfamily N-acetyltransferase
MSFWKNLFAPAQSSPYLDRGTIAAVPNGEAGAPSAADNQPRIILSNTRDIDLYELEELCDSVGWARRPIRKVKKAIQHSFLVVTMWREQGSYRRLIGFARATSDHTFNATVWDVAIHPDYQSRGLGRALMQRVIDDLRAQDIGNITLFADPDVVCFYERLGFTPDPDGIKGMFWYSDSSRR